MFLAPTKALVVEATWNQGVATRLRLLQTLPVTVTGIDDVKLAPPNWENLTVSAANLLAYDDGQLDQFLTEHGFSNLPNLPGVLELSTSDRPWLTGRICQRLDQHGDKSDSETVDANELAQRITDLAQKPAGLRSMKPDDRRLSRSNMPTTKTTKTCAVRGSCKMAVTPLAHCRSCGTFALSPKAPQRRPLL
ncbi:uncharacterized protein LMH87_007556 [Akanthomyces muscarius]|uniref:Uncharacterized protein n=1 Tax=Akanthomyces muscarius TaxID=2231603 RepID=A0A9W8QJZ9_AKAMU|nr:uncharacterized protein LMH87_007556 [Akanthomyces muscarius]KAJ4161520.1 hypothetical protein LMH87_007556 [Akanthomyces muscarius]